MKKLACLILAALTSFVITSCNSGPEHVKNPFLGEIPSIMKYYSVRTAAKEKELNACTEMEKSFELEKEHQLLMEEWDAKISESMMACPLTRPIPFRALDGQPWSVSRITVNLVNPMGIECRISLKLITDLRPGYQDIFLYYQAVDKEGRDIPETQAAALLKPGPGKELKAGTEMDVLGCWTLHGIVNLEDFAGIRFLTSEEFGKCKIRPGLYRSEAQIRWESVRLSF